MADTVVIPPGDVDRLVYVAIAGARDDAETDMLAGLASHLLRRQPTAAVTTLRNAIHELQAAIAPTDQLESPIWPRTVRC